MDAIALLKTDHDKLRDLFDAVSRTFNPEVHKMLLTEIRSILDAHSEIEDTIFYPAVENFNELNLFIKNSYLEHANFENLMKELDETPSDKEEWQLRMKRLLQYAVTHMENEEEELFAKVEKLMPASDRIRLGQYMNSIRDGRAGAA